MRRDVDLIDMIYLTAGYIAKESGRDDLQAEYTKGEGWRLTGLYKDGSRASVGGLGVVPDDREFYHRLTAFWNGVVSMKRWMTGDARCGRKYAVVTKDAEGRPTYWTQFLPLNTLEEVVRMLMNYQSFIKIKEA